MSTDSMCLPKAYYRPLVILDERATSEELLPHVVLAAGLRPDVLLDPVASSQVDPIRALQPGPVNIATCVSGGPLSWWRTVQGGLML